MCEKSMYWFVSDEPALVQIDFEDIRTVSSKCHDSSIFKLLALVEFELDIVSIIQQEWREVLALLIYLHFSATFIIDSLEILVQPEMFSPCNRLQSSASVYIEASVI